MQTIFAFRALSPNGSVDTGTIDAPSAHEARELLAARGLLVATIEHRGPRHQRRERLSTADLALGLRVLADLLESGLPIGRALHAFEELAPRAWHPALPHIRQSVREGQSLAAALSNAPLAIPPLVIGIAQAGEAGTGIGPAVRRAADLTESSAEMQAAVRAALAYPMIVAAAGACAVSVLVLVVLPRFARILADLGQSLPTSTQLVLHGAAIARTLWLPTLAGIMTLLAAWRAWSATPTGRVQWHRFLLHLPILGSIRRRSATSRMAYSLSALLESGVSVSSALMHAARATGDGEIEARLSMTRERIAAGHPLSQALEHTRAVGLTTVRLIRAGEESGRLPAMLNHAAKIEQKGADQTVRTAVRMLEPILLLTRTLR